MRPVFKIVSAFTIAAALAVPAAAAFAADGAKCTIAKPETDVGKACAKGGVKEAKTVMKQMVKDAKKNGVKFDCDSCHKDTEGKYELTDNAKADFAKMVAAIKK